eukprot:CAMPEP_0116961370 /NCGR_PEP_ID=MMETSP0467-20121206/46527_1 /TAXON_ID=283647 /ORGANISM="Mesodinium pulex, Strain SPMC105" /LENGTH=51 /DNA_ID=CAMNT_0004649299 /DNA_START=103 /DNA_END=255 /DNA_ORIENTATION=-
MGNKQIFEVIQIFEVGMIIQKQLAIAEGLISKDMTDLNDIDVPNDNDNDVD